MEAQQGQYNLSMVKRFSELPEGRFLFRSMEDAGGKPALGPTNYQLGLRTNAGELSDISIDNEGTVHPGNEGMSVTPDDPTRLKRYRRPPEWGGDARRPYPVWCIAVDQLGNDLAFQEDPDNPQNHGFIVPARSMPFECYQDAIHSTCTLWEIVIP